MLANSSGLASPVELANALNYLEPGKAPELDYIFTEFMLHSGSALKS